MQTISHLFEAYLKCPMKTWLLSHGQTGGGNTYAEWVKGENENYRGEGLRRLLESVPEAERFVAPPRENPNAAKWRLAVDYVVQTASLAGLNSVPPPTGIAGGGPARPEDGTPAPLPRPIHLSWESRVHAVERAASAGKGKAAQFTPIRIIPRNKLTRDDRLLVAFDALGLTELLGRDVKLGKIIHGDNYAISKIKIAGLLGKVRKLAVKMIEVVKANSSPDLVLNRHCVECEFRDGCRKRAIENDDLSLLANMTEKERKALRDRGIFTVTQPLRRSIRQGGGTTSGIESTSEPTKRSDPRFMSLTFSPPVPCARQRR